MIERLKGRFADEETILALGIAWTVGMLFFTLGGFYLGNIVSVPVPHERDLQVPDMVRSLQGALVGAGVGFLLCSILTAVYPRFTRRDYEVDMAHGGGHHGDDLHGHEANPHHAS